MSDRPHVLLSCAMSVDGYIDDMAPERLLLSNAEDFDRVDEVRASCDAILIGANTIRRDNPRLLVNSAARRAARVAQGLAAYPIKVTITSSRIDPSHKFFHTGDKKLVYCTSPAANTVRAELEDLATVVDAGNPFDFVKMLNDMGNRGIQRLMVEGGSSIHTQFLERDLADEIHLAIAPFFVGSREAPRFVNPSTYPQASGRQMTVNEVRRIGNIIFIDYLVK